MVMRHGDSEGSNESQKVVRSVGSTYWAWAWKKETMLWVPAGVGGKYDWL